MLKHQLIVKSRCCSFVSFPFFIPKNDGSAHIVDYGHLKAAQIYSSPKFCLLPILAIESNRIELV